MASWRPSFRFAVSTAPAAVLKWITAHPFQTALIVAEGFIIFTPAALTAPLLATMGFATMGFGAQGPIAGSVAAWLQSGIGNVGAGSVFAYLQSAGMAGYGTPIVNGICQACAVVHAGVHGAAAAWFGWKKAVVHTTEFSRQEKPDILPSAHQGPLQKSKSAPF